MIFSINSFILTSRIFSFYIRIQPVFRYILKRLKLQCLSRKISSLMRKTYYTSLFYIEHFIIMLYNQNHNLIRRFMYDIAIIGLGPAGSTLARLLDNNFKIIAIDKKSENENEGFQKPCGGLLSPDAQKLLIKFNLSLPVDILANPQIFGVKTIDAKSNIVCNYQRTYINVNRHKFDLWLESLIPDNVEIKNNSYCKKIVKEENSYLVTYVENNTEKTISAKYIVGSDGANSIVRNTIYGKNKIPHYTSIQQWFKDINSLPFYSCIFDKDSMDTCSWSISKDGYFIFGGAFNTKKPRKKFDELKKKLEKYDFNFGEVIKTEACLVLAPKKFTDFHCGKNNAFLIGESAGFISPSSYEGISYAFDSAYKLSQILNSRTGNPNKKYKSKTLKIRLKLMTKIMKAFILYNSFFRKLIMLSGFSNISILDKNEK